MDQLRATCIPMQAKQANRQNTDWAQAARSVTAADQKEDK